MGGLGVREWDRDECGAAQDGQVYADRDILARGQERLSGAMPFLWGGQCANHGPRAVLQEDAGFGRPAAKGIESRFPWSGVEVKEVNNDP